MEWLVAYPSLNWVTDNNYVFKIKMYVKICSVCYLLTHFKQHKQLNIILNTF